MTKQKESSLHWYKFNVLKWNTGDIQHVSYHLKGVFVDLQAYYWSRQCEVSKAQAVKKFKDGNINNLIEAGVVKIDGDNLLIEFLDEQWADVIATSLKNSEKANKRWNKNESNGNATAQPQQSKSNANKIREDKEEIRTDESERREDPKTIFFRIRDEVIASAPSAYFLKNFQTYAEHCSRTAGAQNYSAALEKMDNDYFGATFNDVSHVRNSFKTCLEKVQKEKTRFSQGGPSKGQAILNAIKNSGESLGLNDNQQYYQDEQ